jgi:hypothetical protein
MGQFGQYAEMTAKLHIWALQTFENIFKNFKMCELFQFAISTPKRLEPGTHN